jgi:hypothetical protein
MTATAIRVVAFALLLSCHPGIVSAQERFPRVQYLAGRPDLLKPTEVTLVLDDRELRAEQTVYLDGEFSVRTVFTIPLTNIVGVGSSPRGAADDLLLPGPSGVSSSLTHEEYVTLTLRSQDRIDAILFKVERQQSAVIAARIESAADRALDVPTPQPAKARAVRSHRRPLRMVRFVGGSARQPREVLRKPRARRRSRDVAGHRYLELT